MSLYLGAPVWGLKAWVGNFFPARTTQRDFLRLYSHKLNSVEGNTTFYSLPSQETLARWVAETPVTFRFCLKFPKVISHERRLSGAEAETRSFIACLEGLGERAGPAFLQLPPSFSARSLPQLSAYLSTLPRDFRYAVEVRHTDFYSPPGEAALDAALKDHAAARCIFDSRGLRRADPTLNAATREALERKPDFPARFTRTAPFGFTRFVGHPDLNFNADLLGEWAGHVRQWLAQGDDVFFFCHVPDDREAPQLCQDLLTRIGATLDLPDDDDSAAARFEQGRLF